MRHNQAKTLECNSYKKATDEHRSTQIKKWSRQSNPVFICVDPCHVLRGECSSVAPLAFSSLKPETQNSDLNIRRRPWIIRAYGAP
jgi:hypothetical protein